MITLLTANLGGKRLIEDCEVLISAIRQHNPDIVVLQEVVEVGGIYILDMIKEAVNFPFSLFSFQFDFSKDYGKGVLQEESVINGLGILTKKVFSAEVTKLPIIQGEDRWPRIAVTYKFEDFTLCNVHLSKLKKSRDLEIPVIPEADIYAGDFNMFPDELKSRLDLKSSIEFKHYISFPSKNQTLDYILLTKGTIKDLEVVEGVSDHNGLNVTIDLN